MPYSAVSIFVEKIQISRTTIRRVSAFRSTATKSLEDIERLETNSGYPLSIIFTDGSNFKLHRIQRHYSEARDLLISHLEGKTRNPEP